MLQSPCEAYRDSYTVGEYCRGGGVIKGDTRSLDYSSCGALECLPAASMDPPPTWPLLKPGRVFTVLFGGSI